MSRSVSESSCSDATRPPMRPSSERAFSAHRDAPSRSHSAYARSSVRAGVALVLCPALRGPEGEDGARRLQGVALVRRVSRRAQHLDRHVRLARGIQQHTATAVGQQTEPGVRAARALLEEDEQAFGFGLPAEPDQSLDAHRTRHLGLAPAELGRTVQEGRHLTPRRDRVVAGELEGAGGSAEAVNGADVATLLRGLPQAGDRLPRAVPHVLGRRRARQRVARNNTADDSSPCSRAISTPSAHISSTVSQLPAASSMRERKNRYPVTSSSPRARASEISSWNPVRACGVPVTQGQQPDEGGASVDVVPELGLDRHRAVQQVLAEPTGTPEGQLRHRGQCRGQHGRVVGPLGGGERRLGVRESAAGVPAGIDLPGQLAPEPSLVRERKSRLVERLEEERLRVAEPVSRRMQVCQLTQGPGSVAARG